MRVGYMRRRRIPKQYVKLLAKTTKYHGIDLVFFHPEDIDMENKLINGKILIDNKWVNQEVDIPLFVDLNLYSYKYKNQMKFLKENSYYTAGKYIAKDTLDRKLKEDGEFEHLLIPKINTSTFSEFLNFVKKYKKIIMKPKNGQKGNHIYMISINKNKFILSYENQELVLSKRNLKKFFIEKSNDKKYIFQKYIDSRTKYGDPFDCRVRLEKNGEGKWENVINLIRIGSGQKVVSNVSKGGSVSELDSFLRSNYGERWKDIKESIIHVGETLPHKLEELFNQESNSLGIDIGIDQNGKLYLFETNIAPGVEFGEGAVAMTKSDYYKYMLNKLAK